MNPDTPFPFGKYKGKPLSEVCNDTGYCRWLLEQDFVKGHLKTHIMLHMKAEVIDMNTIVPFGKYKGEPLELLLSDRDYASYVLKKRIFSERIMDFIEAYLE